MALGRLLYKGTWRSASLAVQFFDGSPQLFAKLSVEEARILVRFVDALCDRSYDLASHCLSIAATSLEPLTGEDRAAFLTFAEALASTGWADARSYLEKGPGLLANVQSACSRGRFLKLSRELARREGGRRSHSSRRLRARWPTSTRSRTGCCSRWRKTSSCAPRWLRWSS